MTREKMPKWNPFRYITPPDTEGSTAMKKLLDEQKEEAARLTERLRQALEKRQDNRADG